MLYWRGPIEALQVTVGVACRNIILELIGNLHGNIQQTISPCDVDNGIALSLKYMCTSCSWCLVKLSIVEMSQFDVEQIESTVTGPLTTECTNSCACSMCIPS